MTVGHIPGAFKRRIQTSLRGAVGALSQHLLAARGGKQRPVCCGRNAPKGSKDARPAARPTLVNPAFTTALLLADPASPTGNNAASGRPDRIVRSGQCLPGTWRRSRRHLGVRALPGPPAGPSGHAVQPGQRPGAGGPGRQGRRDADPVPAPRAGIRRRAHQPGQYPDARRDARPGPHVCREWCAAHARLARCSALSRRHPAPRGRLCRGGRGLPDGAAPRAWAWRRAQQPWQHIAGHGAPGRGARGTRPRDRRRPRRRPDHAAFRFHRAMALLEAGAFAAGWSDYEWRWRRPGHPCTLRLGAVAGRGAGGAHDPAASRAGTGRYPAIRALRATGGRARRPCDPASPAFPRPSAARAAGRDQGRRAWRRSAAVRLPLSRC